MLETTQKKLNEDIKLNLGCASRPIQGYINIDLDTIDEMKERYPNIEIPEGLEIFQYDIFDLPYSNNVVSEVRSESMLEHLSFLEEKKFFNVILWWTGGHFQLVGKRTDEADGSAMIKGKKYKLLFENSELPVGLRSIYETQCRWEIPQD